MKTLSIAAQGREVFINGGRLSLSLSLSLSLATNVPNFWSVGGFQHGR
jgi:hypothetical protein